MSWETVALIVGVYWPLAICGVVILWHRLMRKPPIDVELYSRVTEVENDMLLSKSQAMKALNAATLLERDLSTVKASLNLKTFGR